MKKILKEEKEKIGKVQKEKGNIYYYRYFQIFLKVFAFLIAR